MNLDNIQQKINYQFQETKYLLTALTHRSYLNQKQREVDVKEHNERLEFLGDAVLELAVTEHLYTNFLDNEGQLTALRAALVNYKTVAEVGYDFGLENEILLSKGEKSELGQARLSIVANTMEALIGAIYLDGGYIPAKKFINDFLIVKLPKIVAEQTYKDSKTKLQETSQKYNKITPKYKILSSEGKDHEKIFSVGVILGEKMVAIGDGHSKQEAETQAASNALKILEKEITKKKPILKNKSSINKSISG
jgi:ribonuclease-3